MRWVVGKMRSPGFEPGSSARKAEMIDQTTPRPPNRWYRKNVISNTFKGTLFTNYPTIQIIFWRYLFL